MPLKSSVKLKEHQEKAKKKALDNDGNIILYHDVGTGKTLSSIAIAEELKKKKKAKKTLVVTPASLRDNFATDGVKKFTNSSVSIIGNKQDLSSGKGIYASIDSVTPKKSKDYNVVSYDLFKRDPEMYIKNTGADTVIYDEIHRAKNEGTNITKTIKDARKHHRNFIGLTGSLYSNSPADMVPIVDGMTDGKHVLGTKESFESRFMDVDRDGKKRVKNKKVLKALSSKYVDFVDRDDMPSDKPPRRDIYNHDVVMGDVQGDIYRRALDKLDTKTKAKLMLGMGDISEAQMKTIGNKLMGARQASNSIASVTSNISLDKAFEHSAKAQKLISNVSDHLKKTKDGQVILGSQFINGGVDLLEYGLKKEKIPYVKFVGKGNKGVTEKSRQQAIKDYNSGKAKAIIISGAGGEGLNLPNTTGIHMLDGHFNPEVANQMEARGIRSGGLSHRDEKERVVEVHRYTAKPPVKAEDVATGIMSALSPGTYLSRLMNKEKIVRSPEIRAFSADKWIKDVAETKEKNNKEVKNMLKTAGRARLMLSDRDVMDEYYEKFGDKVSDVIGTGDYIDKEEEKRLINKLRKVNKDIVEEKKYSKIQHSGFKKSDFGEDGKMKYTSMLNPTINTPLGFSLTTGGLAALTLLGSKRMRKKHYGNDRGLITAAAPLMGMSSLGGLATYLNSTSGYGSKSKPKAKKMMKMSDEDLLRLLRGESVQKEVKKVDNFAIGG